MASTNPVRLASIFASVLLLAALAAAPASSAPVPCPKATAAAATDPGCSGCAATLTASAFDDDEPAARDVGTTAGTDATLSARLNRGCRLPKGARMVLLRQRIDGLGRPTGTSVALACGRTSCRVSQRRDSAGGYRYQVVIVGCRDAKRSRIVTIVWASKATSPGTTTTPTPPVTTTPASTVTMRFVRAFYDPPSGTTDAQCTVPLPGGAGRASASYRVSHGGYNHAWEWSVPAEITAGAQASTKVTTNATNNGGSSASIAIKTPSELGLAPGANNQIGAVVPVGAPGSDTNQQVYTFNPRRPFTLGEVLYIRIDGPCVSVIYEYRAS